jgi:hypothetical protein
MDSLLLLINIRLVLSTLSVCRLFEPQKHFFMVHAVIIKLTGDERKGLEREGLKGFVLA